MGILMLRAGLRALPWFALALFLTYAPPAALGQGRLALLAGALLLLALGLAPLLDESSHRLGARLARGEAVTWREALATRGRRYFPLLALNGLQLLLLLLLLRAYFLATGSSEGGRDFLAWLLLAACAWLLILLRLWSWLFIPLLIGRETSLRQAGRLSATFLMLEPGPSLLRFGQRQLLILLLGLSGLGLLLGLSSLPALHSCLVARGLLLRHGLDLSPSSLASVDAALPPSGSLRQLLRPWE